MPTLKLKNKPCIGITIGDPAGIGIEIVAKSLKKTSIRRLATYKVIGDSLFFKKYNLKNTSYVELVDVQSKNIHKITSGQPSSFSGKASLNYLNKAVELIKAGKITGLVTAPVSKEAISKTYKNFIGHTEFLADAFNIKDIGMLFVSEKMRVIILTRHIPVKDIPRNLNASKILNTVKLTNKYLKQIFGIQKPKIGICGLNPHAGENGKIGHEEITTIIPAVKKAQKLNIDIKGPFAADTLFSIDLKSHYDCIIAIYHDQGLIPIKTLYLNKLINLTIGLPFIRTSPAHGTAFDIAGKNNANPSSMIEAIKFTASHCS